MIFVEHVNIGKDDILGNQITDCQGVWCRSCQFSKLDSFSALNVSSRSIFSPNEIQFWRG